MDYEAARIKMVDNQIRTTDVTSHSILSAFLEVPRELFVPENLRPLAYIDNDLEIAPCRFVMEPSPLAKLLQLAEIQKTDLVLEVACGSGYATAILAKLAAKVVAVENDEGLVETTRQNLANLGIENVSVVGSDLEMGQAAGGPYDVIFINGAVEIIPDSLLRQIKNGGRLVGVVGYGNASRATVIVCENGQCSERLAFNTSVKALPGFRKKAEFVF